MRNFIFLSFRHNFDVFINYQQYFVVLFGQKRSGTKPKLSQKKSCNLVWYSEAYGKQHLRIDLCLLQCPKNYLVNNQGKSRKESDKKPTLLEAKARLASWGLLFSFASNNAVSTGFVTSTVAVVVLAIQDPFILITFHISCKPQGTWYQIDKCTRVPDLNNNTMRDLLEESPSRSPSVDPHLQFF